MDYYNTNTWPKYYLTLDDDIVLCNSEIDKMQKVWKNCTVDIKNLKSWGIVDTKNWVCYHSHNQERDADATFHLRKYFGV